MHHSTRLLFCVDTGLPMSSGFEPRDPDYGYAPLSLMAPATRVLTVELKVNLLSPAVGKFLIARGEVVRPGRTLTICRGDAYAVSDDGSKHVATMLATMTAVAEGSP
jgi:acyl-coenzyme A thioesterase PaaI-like protein